MEKTPSRTTSSDSSSSSSPSSSSDPKDPTAPKPTAQAQTRPVAGGIQKKRKEPEADGLTPAQVQREAEKRFAKYVVESQSEGKTATSEEAVQATLDKLMAAHAAQHHLGGTGEPSDDEPDDDGSSSSRSTNQQRGRGPPAPSFALTRSYMNTLCMWCMCTCMCMDMCMRRCMCVEMGGCTCR